ncbi:MAG: chromate efflux transporter [Candidatus Tectimicrobiota bacterium]
MNVTAEAAGPLPQPRPGSALEVLRVATRLGLTSFGGPIAHLGYFRAEYVVRRRWLDEHTYADLVALCQFLPGPASSQVGIAIGLLRAGLLGGLASWIGFTLPSALALMAFAYGLQTLGGTQAAWLHGLKVVAVAVVAQAVWGMAQNLTPDRQRVTLAVLAASATLLWPGALGQVLILLAAAALYHRLAVAGGAELPQAPLQTPAQLHLPISRAQAVTAWVLFAACLIGLPLLRRLLSSQPLAVFDSFFRVGSLVFGGGHVVLPLMQAEVVPPGWVSNAQFVAGYGAAQAVPGPLFTFAAYLGTVMSAWPHGWVGGLFALVAVFLPSFLLIVGGLPLWNLLRAQAHFQTALRGINAAVVGLLLAALYHPVWTSAIQAPADFALGLADFIVLVFWQWPPWLVVICSALAGMLLARL